MKFFYNIGVNGNLRDLDDFCVYSCCIIHV